MENPIMKTPLFSLIVASALLLAGCQNCHENLKKAVPVADSLFVHGDSAAFHKAAAVVLKASECVLSKSDSDAAKLDAKVARETTDQQLAGWACHARIRDMQEFHAAIEANADKMTEVQWAEAMETWTAKEDALETDHRAAYCVDADREVLLAMKADFVAWTASNSVDDLLEEAGKAIEDVLDEGLQLIEDLFSE